MRKIKFLVSGDAIFCLNAQFCHCIQPLLPAGPSGLKDRATAVMEILFPDLAQIKQKFPIEFIEFYEEKEELWKGIKIIPYEVAHASGAPPYALRIEGEGKILAYSCDT